MIRLPVSEIFRSKSVRGVVSVPPGATVTEAVALMKRYGIGAIIVASGRTVHGIFTERDLMCRVVDERRDPAITPVETVMSPEVRRVPSSTAMDDALRLMVEHNYRHLLVADDHDLAGVVSIRDLMQWALLADVPPHEGRPGVLKARTEDAIAALRSPG